MAVDATNLNALQKQIYADKVVNLIPDDTTLCKDYAFRSAASTGNQFVQPVKMSHESGFTYSNDDYQAFALNAEVPAVFKDALVNGSSIVLRSALGYVQLARLDNSKKGFMGAPAALIEDMNQSMWKRLEIAGFYGQSAGGLATLSAAASMATTMVLTISATTLAPGMWAGSEGSQIDLFTAGLLKRNISPVVIKSADVAAGTLSCTVSAADVSGAVFAATDIIVWKGAFGEIATGAAATPIEPVGLDKIINNNGTLYGIDASVYSLWKSSVKTSVGALTIKAILQTIDLAVAKGLKGDVNVYIPSKAFQSLSTVEMTYRRYDQSYEPKKAVAGVQALEFNHQMGRLFIKPSIYVKAGDFFVTPVEGGYRIGASDVTFNTPGYSNKDMFLQLTGEAGVGIRCFSHQAFFFEKPAHLAKGEGVTYS